MVMALLSLWILSVMPSVDSCKAVVHEANATMMDVATPFDEWGDIPFRDEKARLDNAAIYLQKDMPRYVIYLVIYAGSRACVGEARERGIRAKKHLMSRGVPARQVVWIDGGYRSEVSTTVWIWPPEEPPPVPSPEQTLKLSEVKLEKNCKIKFRGSR